MAENINRANTIYDICPKLWEQIGLPSKVRIKLDSLKKTQFALSYYTYSKDEYSMLVDIESVELVSESAAPVKANSNSVVLSPEQKKLIQTIPLGNSISILVRFRIKNSEVAQAESEVKTGILYIDILPSTEAKYVGGFEKMCELFNAHTYHKIENKKEYAQLSFIRVKFVVDATGHVVSPELTERCKNEKLNQMVLQTLSKMPQWIPAKDSKGKNISETFEFYFGNNDFDGC